MGADEPDGVRIERDPSFSRHYADAGFAYDLGRDLELSFLQSGPEIFEEPEEPEGSGRRGLYAVPTRSEVSRVRIRPGAAVALAFDILDEVVRERRVKFPAIERSLNRVLEQIAELRVAEAEVTPVAEHKAP